MATLFRLDRPVLNDIISRLDRNSLLSFRLTCHYNKMLCNASQFAGFTFPPAPVPVPASAPAPAPAPAPALAATTTTVPASATPPSTTFQDHDLRSINKEMSSLVVEEEAVWHFELTPEIERRVSLLPNRSTGNTLSSFPAELQLEIFSHLDQIDSCCLGLTAPNLYVVYRAIHGTKMPLSTRRVGPNSLESAWEVVGKQECKQCGVYRCELHQHIKSWMPKGLEYCYMKQNFGRPAINSSKAVCFRGKPSKPRRCGRHPQRTTTIHQDDTGFNLAVGR